MGIDHKKWMRIAIDYAMRAQQLDEVPVGAVIVSDEQNIVTTAHNTCQKNNDCTNHAELLAIHDACRTMKTQRLTNCTIYVTLEPCAMCAGAIMHARLHTLVFGLRDFRSGAAGSVMNVFHATQTHPGINIIDGVLESESKSLLQNFFKTKR